MPEKSSHAPWWTLGVAAVAVAGLVWLVLAGMPQVEQPVAEVVLPRTVSYSALVKANEDLERMVASLQVEREELRAALVMGPEELESLRLEAGRVPGLERDLEAALAEARKQRGEAARYQAGLSRAVMELNRRGAAQPPPPAPAAPRERSGPVYSTTTPRVAIAGDVVVVTGTVRNTGGRDRRALVELALLRDGEVVEAQESYVVVPGGGSQAVSARFRHRGSAGTFSGRVRVIE